jgi:hypothetical protein
MAKVCCTVRPIKKPTKTVRFGNQSWNTPTPLVLPPAGRFFGRFEGVGGGCGSPCGGCFEVVRPKFVRGIGGFVDVESVDCSVE